MLTKLTIAIDSRLQFAVLLAKRQQWSQSFGELVCKRFVYCIIGVMVWFAALVNSCLILDY